MKLNFTETDNKVDYITQQLTSAGYYHTRLKGGMSMHVGPTINDIINMGLLLWPEFRVIQKSKIKFPIEGVQVRHHSIATVATAPSW